jgi:hypothetical protein
MYLFLQDGTRIDGQNLDSAVISVSENEECL